MEKQPRPNKDDQRLAKITQFYMVIGLFTARFDAYDGVLLMKESGKRATEILAVARHHKPMMEFIDRLIEGNDYYAAALGHGAMLYAMLAHHGRLPSDDMTLLQLGYHPSQVLAMPEGMDGNSGIQNGQNPTTARA